MDPASVTATRDILLHYKAVCQTSDDRRALCQDETLLNFLVYVLQETTDEVVHLSLKVLTTLCEEDDLCRVVSDTLGLSPSLELLSSGSYPFEVKETALRLKMRILEAKVARLTLQAAQNSTPEHPRHRRETHLANSNCSLLLTQSNSTAKVVVLHIEGLRSEFNRELCEERLLAIPGVISFTFDLTRRQCIVRTKPNLSSKVLVQAIKSTGKLSAMQVSNAGAHQTVPSQAPVSPSLADKENFPEYLPETESPIRDDALVRSKKAAGSAASWIGSAATFIAKSLYW